MPHSAGSWLRSFMPGRRTNVFAQGAMQSCAGRCLALGRTFESWFKLVRWSQPQFPLPTARQAMLCPFCKVERSKRFWKPSQWRSWSATAGEFNCCSECDISCYKPTLNMDALLAEMVRMKRWWNGAPKAYFVQFISLSTSAAPMQTPNSRSLIAS